MTDVAPIAKPSSETMTGPQLRAAREAAGLSIEDASGKIRIRPAALARLEQLDECVFGLSQTLLVSRIDLAYGLSPGERRCRGCGCTETDCSECFSRTGHPCQWVSNEDLCTACLSRGFFG